MLTYTSIIETAQSHDGRWYARVGITNNGVAESMFISFPSQPTPAQVEAEARRIVLARNLDSGYTAAEVIGKTEFLGRFTDTELKNVMRTAKSNESIELMLERLRMADKVNLRSESLTASIRALEAANLIGTGRADQILGLA